MSCLVWLFKPTGLDRETRERCHLKAKYFCLNQNQLLSLTIRFTIPTNLFQSPPLLLIIMQRQAKKQKSSIKTIPAWGDLFTSSWFACNLSKWCCLRDVVFLRNVSNHLNVFFKTHLYTETDGRKTVFFFLFLKFMFEEFCKQRRSHVVNQYYDAIIIKLVFFGFGQFVFPP